MLWAPTTKETIVAKGKEKKQWRKAVSSTQIRLKKGAAKYFKKHAHKNEPIGATVCRLVGIDENGKKLVVKSTTKKVKTGIYPITTAKTTTVAKKVSAKPKKAKGGKHAKRTKGGSKKAARAARKR